MIFYSVHFNRPDFIPIQKECVEELSGGKLVVINNGPSPGISEACQKHVVKYYDNYNDPSINSSRSHALALNYLRGIIDYSDDWCILDHDLFPLKKIEFTDFDILTPLQSRPPYGTYLWPGFMAGKKEISLNDIDFSPAPGMDTGAGTSELIKRGYKIRSVREEYLGQEKTGYKQNSPIIVKMEDYGIHYLNGSSWMHTEGSVIEEKNKALLDYIQETKNKAK